MPPKLDLPQVEPGWIFADHQWPAIDCQPGLYLARTKTRQVSFKVSIQSLNQFFKTLASDEKLS